LREGVEKKRKDRVAQRQIYRLRKPRLRNGGNVARAWKRREKESSTCAAANLLIEETELRNVARRGKEEKKKELTFPAN
jgi:hypothetical protein